MFLSVVLHLQTRLLPRLRCGLRRLIPIQIVRRQTVIPARQTIRLRQLPPALELVWEPRMVRRYLPNFRSRRRFLLPVLQLHWPLDTCLIVHRTFKMRVAC